MALLVTAGAAMAAASRGAALASRPPRLPTTRLLPSLVLPLTRQQSTQPAAAAAAPPSTPAKPYYVTTPIYYATAGPHIGHLYSSLLADMLARAASLGGHPGDPPPRLSTGTDEHGLKVQQAASGGAVGREAVAAACSTYCDGIAAEYAGVHDAYGIAYSTFMRTSSPRHAAVVRWLWRRLVRADAIYVGRYEGWYCQSDEAFLTAPQTCTRAEYAARRGLEPPAAATGEVRVSAESGHPVEWVAEENYMFRLSNYTAALQSWINGSGGSAGGSPVVPAVRANEVMAFLAGGLTDLSVSRSSAKIAWALPVPDNPAHCIYVWVDALANYLTAAMDDGNSAGVDAGGDLPDDADSAALFPAWPADVHVVGKDILRFHAVYWPALLMAAGLPLPRRIVAHGHWTVGRAKMSKSLGNVVRPADLVAPRGAFTVDAIRYFLLREGGLASDGDFSPALLHHRCNAECADAFGNLASRILRPSFLPGGRLPLPYAAIPGTPAADVPGAAVLPFTEAEAALAAKLGTLASDVMARYGACDGVGALDAVMGAVDDANRVFATAEPWKLMKAPGGALRATAVLYITLETLRIAAALFAPVMPATAGSLLRALGQPPVQHVVGGCAVGSGVGGSGTTAATAVFGAVPPAAYAIDTSTPLVLVPKPPPAVAAPSATAASPARKPPVAARPSKQGGGGGGASGRGAELK